MYGTNTSIVMQNASTGTGANNGFYLGNGNGSIAYVWNYENDSMRFATNNTERLRITSGGDIGLATATPNLAGFSSPVTSVGKSGNAYSVLELQGNQTSDGAFGLVVGYNSGGSARTTQINMNRQAANNSGAISFETASAGTLGERVRITNDGLTFGGDTATANALDDYEEGTWTATAEYGTGGFKTCTPNVCRYVKVGGLVQISGRFSLNTHTGGSGELRIGGLPFAKGNPSGDGNADGIAIYIEGAASNITNSISGLVLDTQTVFYVRRSGTTGSGNDMSGLTDTGTTLLVGGTYSLVGD